MGGHSCGEVASAMAVKVIRDEVLERLKSLTQTEDGSVRGSDVLGAVLCESIRVANGLISSRSGNQDNKAARMGTTVVSLLFQSGKCAIAHVGDSRIYMLRGDRVYILTQDHSLVNEQLRANLISIEEARTSAYRHIVTRALGMREEVEVEVQELVVRPGDMVLLCSDGLFDMTDENDIRDILYQFSDDLGVTTRKLIELANSRGGEDNITVVVAKMVGEEGDFEKIEDAEATRSYPVD